MTPHQAQATIEALLSTLTPEDRWTVVQSLQAQAQAHPPVPKPRRTSPKRAFILRAFQTYGILRAQDLHTLLIQEGRVVSMKETYNRLVWLAKQGEIRRVARGVYASTSWTPSQVPGSGQCPALRASPES